MKKETRTNIKGRVARILFNESNGTLTKYRIAKLADSGYPWIHNLLKKLEEQGIIQKTRIRDFKALMTWWKRWQPIPKYREYMVQRPLELLKETNLEYALTTYQADNKVQNYLFPSRTDIYIHSSDKQRWHELLVQNGLVGKGNVRILIGDDHVFYKSFAVDDLTLVSIPQIVLDLYSEGGVCIEAGDLLLEKMEKDALRKL